MALADVLTAVRVLLQDGRKVASEQAEREEQYKGWFPKLSSAEIEDLAKIPPEQLDIYTSTIFTGEASIFRNHFKITLQYLERFWPPERGPLKLVPFVQRVHKRTPWKSYRTQELVNNICAYLQNEMPDLLARFPFVGQLAELEASTVRLKRMDEAAGKTTTLTLKEYAQLSVEDLLEHSLALNNVTTFKRWDYNLAALHEGFHYQERALPDKLEKIESFCLGSRNSEQAIFWTSLPGAVYEFLEKLKAPAPLWQLAQIFTESQPEQDETELFQAFSNLLVQLMQRGAVIVAAPL